MGSCCGTVASSEGNFGRRGPLGGPLGSSGRQEGGQREARGGTLVGDARPVYKPYKACKDLIRLKKA